MTPMVSLHVSTNGKGTIIYAIKISEFQEKEKQAIAEE